MKRWNTPMKRCSSSRGIALVANSLSARRRGVMVLGLGLRRVGVGEVRARNRRHGARGDFARLARLRRLDEELRLLDALLRELRGHARGRARVAVEQVAAERALREPVE